MNADAQSGVAVRELVYDRLRSTPLRGDHQHSGARWMLEKEMRTDGGPRGGILADEVGMGKTFVTLGVIYSRLVPRTLIVTPVATTFQWRREVVEKFPQLRDRVTHVMNNHTPATRGEYWQDEEVVITSYENLRGGPAWIVDTHWDRVILDEGHVTRNPATQVNHAMRRLHMDVCWILTATPIHNDIRDLVSLLRTCRVMPPLAAAEDDDDSLGFEKEKEKKRKTRKPATPVLRDRDYDVLRVLQKEYMLRRTVDRENVNNPHLRLKPLSVTVVSVDWASEYERELYETLRKVAEVGGLHADRDDDTAATTGVMTVQSIVYMRQLCVSFRVLAQSIRKKSAAVDGAKIQKTPLSLTRDELEGYSDDDDDVREDAEARASASSTSSTKKKKKKRRTSSKAEEEDRKKDEDYMREMTSKILFGGGGERSSATTKVVVDEDETQKKRRREEDRNRRRTAKTMVCGVLPRTLFHDPEAIVSSRSIREALDAADPVKRRIAMRKELGDIPASPLDAPGALPVAAVYKHVTSKYVARGELPRVSSKMLCLREILARNFSDPATRDDKVIVFTTFMAEMREVCASLFAQGVGYSCISGDMNTVQRDQSLHSFHVVPGIRVLVAQINCASTGINLQCANVAIITSPTWNPCVEEQAVGRVHRQGQTKPVRVYRLEMRGTIESHCLGRQHDKTLIIDDYVTRGGARADPSNDIVSRQQQQQSCGEHGGELVVA